MLSGRQTDILLYLLQKDGQYVRANDIASKYNVSSRTILSDFGGIRTAIKNNGAEIDVSTAFGFRLLIKDEKTFSYFLKDIVEENFNDSALSDKAERGSYIANRLLYNKGDITYDTLADEMYISKSLLYQDITALREVMCEYDLELVASGPSGLEIKGSEISKRQLLIHYMYSPNESLLWMKRKGFVVNTIPLFDELKQLMLESFECNDISMSDKRLYHTYVFTAVSVLRMQDGWYVEENKASLSKTGIYAHALRSAEDIMRICSEEYGIEYNKSEVETLAVLINGNRYLKFPSSIPQEITDFIEDTLAIIHVKYGIDYSRDSNLIMDLSLHTLALLSRVEIKNECKSQMIYEIKRDVPLAYDIASTFSLEMYKRYHVKMSEDEVSFIAAHFSVGKASTDSGDLGLRVALVSPLQRSETVILRRKLSEWFPTITDFEMVNPSVFGKTDMSPYDIVFTTEAQIMRDYSNIMLINNSLESKDFERIKLHINGFSSTADIVDKFDKSISHFGKSEDKESIIKKLCILSEKAGFCKCETMFESVMKHETISGSYFGNQIAVPHPDRCISDRSFIAVGVIPDGVKWEKKHTAKLVMLISIQKDRPAAYRLWDCISYIISDENFSERVAHTPTYENFINEVKMKFDAVFNI